VSSLQPVRGTRDLLPADSRRHRHVLETAREVAERYGFGDMVPPVFEFTEVFKRTLGETSDVVQKEMYTFLDRGGDEITLRPEFTAGIARALISGGLSQNLPLKFFSHGPVFRYERPQLGRLRQFHQINVEVLGIAEPQADLETIVLAAHILEELEVINVCTLELNSLGDPASRAAYRKVLVEFLADHRATLSKDSQARLERNPLRVLDSKDVDDSRIVADAPSILDHLTAESADFFAALREGLDALAIAYAVNPRLVRGLDYYTHTAFEFTTESLGAQGAVIAGGRYDGLVEAMGGPSTPGVGWAGGIERLVMLCTNEPAPHRPVAVIPVGGAQEIPALRLAHDLRRAGFVVELGARGNLTRRLKRANKLNAACAVIVGGDELARGAVTLRDLDSGAQAEVALAEIEDHLTSFR